MPRGERHEALHGVRGVSRGSPANLPASVHDRLLRQARERGEDFNFVLVRYGIERFLYRLSVSSHAERFVLKGAMLFAVWSGQPHRPTKDLDLLGRSALSSEDLERLLREVCTTEVPPDGLRFDADNIEIAPIRDEQPYGGWRAYVQAYMARSRIRLQIDVGFGDVVTPAAREMVYPALLDSPPSRILTYPPETVVAEKLEAMVSLGMVGSRMSDYYDVLWMAENLPFEGAVLAEAIRRTFGRRTTAVPQQPPIALTDEFAGNQGKITQWRAFLENKRLEAPRPDLRGVLDELRAFLLPPLQAVASGEKFQLNWSKAGPWSESAP